MKDSAKTDAVINDEVTDAASPNKNATAKKEVEKVVYNGVELMALGNTEPKYLMKPIFPQKGTAILSGKPDTGKSQLARQLCLQVALGEENFLGFKLSLIHNRSIYVATEDDVDSTSHAMSKQFAGLGKDAVENFRVITADTMSQKEILSKLDAELTLAPVDIAVVDSFGDIFEGDDSNKNTAMRKTVKSFDKLAKKHGCLILFVHHVNKAAYRQSPGQEQIQGGSGLVQKVRLAIILYEGEGNKRYFSVVKGNYCPKEHKQKSLELTFSEQTLLFTNTGNTVLTSELGTQPNNIKKVEKANELEAIAEIIISDSSVTHGAFVKEYKELTSKSEVTGARDLEKLVKSGFVTKDGKNYRIATKFNDEEKK